MANTSRDVLTIRCDIEYIIVTAQPATNSGYICEPLYADGTPATLWNTNNNIGTGSNLSTGRKTTEPYVPVSVPVPVPGF